MSDNNNDNGAARRLANLLKFLEDAEPNAGEDEMESRLRAAGLDPARATEQMRFAIDGAVDRFYAARAKAQRECQGQDASQLRWSGTKEPSSPTPPAEASRKARHRIARPSTAADSSRNGGQSRKTRQRARRSYED